MARLRSSRSSARLLGLPPVGERALVALFVMNTLALAVVSGGALGDPLGVLCLVGILAGAVVCALPAPYPFPMSRTAIVLAIVIAATLGAAVRLPRDGSVDEYSAWHLGTGAFLLLALALRGRIISAWAGMAGMTAITTIWATTTADGTADGLGLISRPAGTLLIGTLFAVGITRIAERVDEIAAAEALTAADAAALGAATAERRRRLDQIAELAGPALVEIASPRDLSDADRHRFARIEASVRDAVRGGALAVPPLSDAAEVMRTQGIDVVLLDDAELTHVSGELVEFVSRWAAERVLGSKHGPVTVRMTADAGTARVTLVRGDQMESMEVPTSARPAGSDLG